ncbi:hypothetical protein V8J56_003659 [Providencia rettgeri]
MIKLKRGNPRFFYFPYCFLVHIARLNYRHQLNVVFSDITPRHFVGDIWYRAIS